MKLTRREFDELWHDPTVDLNAQAKMILMAYAVHMNYTKEPVTAYKKIEDMAACASLHHSTAKDYRDALVADGFLIDSGLVEPTQYHNMPRYYLGKGTSTHRLIQKRKANNAKNLAKKDEATSGVPRQSPNNNLGSRSNQPRESLQATSGVAQTNLGSPDTNNTRNNQGKNQRNNHKADSAVAPPASPDGTTDLSLENPGEPTYLSKEAERETDSTTEGAATSGVPRLVGDYDELAREADVFYAYTCNLKVPGVSKKQAFKMATKGKR